MTPFPKTKVVSVDQRSSHLLGLFSPFQKEHVGGIREVSDLPEAEKDKPPSRLFLMQGGWTKGEKKTLGKFTNKQVELFKPWGVFNEIKVPWSLSLAPFPS